MFSNHRLYAHGYFVQVVALIHGDVVIARDHFRSRQTVGGDHGVLLEVTVSADVVAMLVRVDDHMDIADFQAGAAQAAFQYGEILVGSRIDHHIHVVALDHVTTLPFRPRI